MPRGARHHPGDTFGKLTLIAYQRGGWWLCQCACGRTTRVITGNLSSGNTKSCGCFGAEASRNNIEKARLSILETRRAKQTDENKYAAKLDRLRKEQEAEQKRQLNEAAANLVNIWFGKK